jgi:hypothetical protein
MKSPLTTSLLQTNTNEDKVITPDSYRETLKKQ